MCVYRLIFVLVHDSKAPEYFWHIVHNVVGSAMVSYLASACACQVAAQTLVVGKRVGSVAKDCETQGHKNSPMVTISHWGLERGRICVAIWHKFLPVRVKMVPIVANFGLKCDLAGVPNHTWVGYGVVL
eukprot:jgi/Botrbrau1/7047/Bobra.0165s0070.1